MAVDARWGTVGRPSSVCNACVVVEDFGEVGLLCGDQLLELDNLANLLECENFLLLVAVDC